MTNIICFRKRTLKTLNCIICTFLLAGNDASTISRQINPAVAQYEFIRATVCFVHEIKGKRMVHTLKKFTLSLVRGYVSNKKYN
jgi:hypothetical protein